MYRRGRFDGAGSGLRGTIARRILFPAMGLALAMFLAANATADPANDLTAADRVVLQIRDAASEGDLDRVDDLAPHAAGSVLAPYVAYWQAELRLRGPEYDDTAAQAFLRRYADTPLAARMRADWLMALARKGDFARFETLRPTLGGVITDPQLVCASWLASYDQSAPARRKKVALMARRVLANVTNPGGEACSALADRLLDDGAMSVWPRLMALEESRQFTPTVRVADARLPHWEARAVRRILSGSGIWFSRHRAHLDRIPPPMLALALIALAQTAPDRAAWYAARVDRRFSADERAAVWGRIATLAEYRWMPQASRWFRRGGPRLGMGPDATQADAVLTAQARAALWQGASRGFNPSSRGVGDLPASASAPRRTGSRNSATWRALRRAIAALPLRLREQPNWVYWDAQARIALGQGQEGRAALRGLAGRFDYYGMLAAEDLGLPARAFPRQPPADPNLVDELARRPGFLRARKLYELDLRWFGNAEWSWALHGMDDKTLRAAAELGRRWGLLDRMIASSERIRSGIDLAQQFPMPYQDLLTRDASSRDLDPAWVYGLIRQESRFIQQVYSRTGAIGLMQLMPSTARYVAHRMGMTAFRPDHVSDVETNLKLGTEYLKLVYDDQGGLPLLASAAYNAGPHAVRRWRASLTRTVSGARFAEAIPVEETRGYVQKVLFNTMVYESLLGRRPVSLKTLLATVTPEPIPAADLP